jgi:hypothetical protein
MEFKSMGWPSQAAGRGKKGCRRENDDGSVVMPYKGTAMVDETRYRCVHHLTDHVTGEG